MSPTHWWIVLSVGLFVGMLICLEAGYRLGRRDAGKHADMAHEGIGLIDAAVFSLLGLLLGFSFAGGMSRLDARRDRILHEANAIDTAYQRLDVLPAAAQPPIRTLFREYLDSRLRAGAQLASAGASEKDLRYIALQQQIWSLAVAASRTDPTQNTARLLLPALNEMIGVTAERSIALHVRLPSLIFALLMIIALMSGLLAGYSVAKRRRRSWLHIISYAVVVALTIYTVLDLDSPRAGLIRVRSAENALIQLQESMRQGELPHGQPIVRPGKGRSQPAPNVR